MFSTKNGKHLTSLTFCTFNIRYNNPDDGEHSWKNRIQAITSLLASQKIDILGTQEGKENQLNEFQNIFKKHPMIMGHRTWIKERMYPTLFFSYEQLNVIDSGDIWLSETPEIAGSSSFNSMFPRLCTWATLSIKASLRPILIVNVHLDHISTETRIKQIEVLIKQIKLIQQNMPMVLMGDFNEGPSETVYNRLLQSFPSLYDPWVYTKTTEMSTHHGFSGDKLKGKRIDWILLDKKFQVEAIEAITESHDGIFPSDHFPIICKTSLLK